MRKISENEHTKPYRAVGVTEENVLNPTFFWMIFYKVRKIWSSDLY
jgi:hypothetical protein